MLLSFTYLIDDDSGYDPLTFNFPSIVYDCLVKNGVTLIPLFLVDLTPEKTLTEPEVSRLLFQPFDPDAKSSLEITLSTVLSLSESLNL